MAITADILEEIRKGTAKAIRWARVSILRATPTGMVVDYAGSTAPTGWLVCDGTAVSRTTYADLFSVIGETYGAGDGSTTFALPDARGRVTAGVDGSAIRLTNGDLGDVDGDETATGTGGAASFNKTVMNSNQNSHSHGAGTYYARITGQTSTDDIHMQRDTSIPDTWNATHATTDINFGGGVAVSGHGSGTAVGGTSSTSTVSWDSSTVNTSFTNPSTKVIQPTLVLNKIIKY